MQGIGRRCGSSLQRSHGCAITDHTAVLPSGDVSIITYLVPSGVDDKKRLSQCKDLPGQLWQSKSYQAIYKTAGSTHELEVFTQVPTTYTGASRAGFNLKNNLRSSPPAPALAYAMCDWYQNFYIYSSCADPGVHFFKTSMDGSKDRRCLYGPHERYIVIAGSCPLC